jgi:hypothetical protein
MRLSRRVLLWAVPGLFAAACLSPTLPLPPPAVPEVQQIGQGQYQLTGSLPVPGTVLVLNQRTRIIKGQGDVLDLYQMVVTAAPGDAMVIWYESGNDKSDERPFVIDQSLSPPPDAGPPPTDAGKQ